MSSIIINIYRICGNILSSSLSHMNLEGMHWFKSVICRELSMWRTQVMKRASDDQRMAYRSIALCMTWHRQTSHPGLMRNWRLGFILIYELMMKLCSSGKPLMNLGKLGMFGGPCLVENRWSALTMCIRCPRMVEKAVEALRFVSLIDLSCQESSSWKPKFLMRAIRFWLYIYGNIYYGVYAV